MRLLTTITTIHRGARSGLLRSISNVFGVLAYDHPKSRVSITKISQVGVQSQHMIEVAPRGKHSAHGRTWEPQRHFTQTEKGAAPGMELAAPVIHLLDRARYLRLRDHRFGSSRKSQQRVVMRDRPTTRIPIVATGTGMDSNQGVILQCFDRLK